MYYDDTLMDVDIYLNTEHEASLPGLCVVSDIEIYEHILFTVKNSAECGRMQYIASAIDGKNINDKFDLYSIDTSSGFCNLDIAKHKNGNCIVIDGYKQSYISDINRSIVDISSIIYGSCYYLYLKYDTGEPQAIKFNWRYTNKRVRTAEQTYRIYRYMDSAGWRSIAIDYAETVEVHSMEDMLSRYGITGKMFVSKAFNGGSSLYEKGIEDPRVPFEKRINIIGMEMIDFDGKTIKTIKNQMKTLNDEQLVMYRAPEFCIVYNNATDATEVYNSAGQKEYELDESVNSVYSVELGGSEYTFIIRDIEDSRFKSYRYLGKTPSSLVPEAMYRCESRPAYSLFTGNFHGILKSRKYLDNSNNAFGEQASHTVFLKSKSRSFYVLAVFCNEEQNLSRLKLIELTNNRCELREDIVFEEGEKYNLPDTYFRLHEYGIDEIVENTDENGIYGMLMILGSRSFEKNFLNADSIKSRLSEKPENKSLIVHDGVYYNRINNSTETIKFVERLL